MQEKQLYHKVLSYLNSLPSAADSDFVNLQHIHKVAEEIELKSNEVRLYINAETEPEKNGRWKSIPFTHPATIDTAMIDSEFKTKVKSDLEQFLKSKQYYHRLGRVWKRSYLLYGQSGTGKSSFIAGMPKFLCYDLYDVDMSKVTGDSDLKLLLLQTTSKSMIVVEDLDKYLFEKEKSTAVSLSGILNFMDGIISCCGEERIMVFTVSNKDQIDPTVLRPGRIDVHIHFPLCDFSSFKNLANSHLGIKEHKLFPQVEEIFQTGASLSPAEIGEIMISNRGSPIRALKMVINALQTNNGSKLTGLLRPSHKLSHSSGASRNLSHSRSIDGSAELPSEMVHNGSARVVEEATESGLERDGLDRDSHSKLPKVHSLALGGSGSAPRLGLALRFGLTGRLRFGTSVGLGASVRLDRKASVRHLGCARRFGSALQEGFGSAPRLGSALRFGLTGRLRFDMVWFGGPASVRYGSVRLFGFVESYRDFLHAGQESVDGVIEALPMETFGIFIVFISYD
ncbi:hypothetical protein LXL04_003148 [Taraxacum kok-saghyz]